MNVRVTEQRTLCAALKISVHLLRTELDNLSILEWSNAAMKFSVNLLRTKMLSILDWLNTAHCLCVLGV